MSIEIKYICKWHGGNDKYFILNDDKEIGDLTYKKLENNDIDLFLIFIEEERKGIGTAVINILRSEYNDIYLSPMNDAVGFWKKMGGKPIDEKGNKWVIRGDK